MFVSKLWELTILINLFWLHISNLKFYLQKEVYVIHIIDSALFTPQLISVHAIRACRDFQYPRHSRNCVIKLSRSRPTLQTDIRFVIWSDMARTTQSKSAATLSRKKYHACYAMIYLLVCTFGSVRTWYSTAKAVLSVFQISTNLH